LENMRREGFEMFVEPPEVIEKMVNGVRCEPWDMLEITVDDAHRGAVLNAMQLRKAELKTMIDGTGSTVMLNYLLPTRATLGLRSQLLTCTRGTALITCQFDSYRPLAQSVSSRQNGCILALDEGEVTSKGVLNAHEHGTLFVAPGDKVYKNMIVGAATRQLDIRINICRERQLTNFRQSVKAVYEATPQKISTNIDSAFEFITTGEVVEITPGVIRMARISKEKR